MTSLQDRIILDREVKEVFLERIARKKANDDMSRLYALNAPRENKISLLSRFISHIKP